MANQDMITGLLHTLAHENNQITWKTKCCFIDGEGRSFHEISLYWKKEKKQKMIIYQMETGTLLNYVCKGLNLSNCDTVVDVLLDLINEQKMLASPSLKYE